MKTPKVAKKEKVLSKREFLKIFEESRQRVQAIVEKEKQGEIITPNLYNMVFR